MNKADTAPSQAHPPMIDTAPPSYRTAVEVGSAVQVLVRDNNVDQALRALKKKMQREGVFREMKLRRNYEAISSAACGVRSFPYTPLMSYALKISSLILVSGSIELMVFPPRFEHDL